MHTLGARWLDRKARVHKRPNLPCARPLAALAQTRRRGARRTRSEVQDQSDRGYGLDEPHRWHALALLDNGPPHRSESEDLSHSVSHPRGRREFPDRDVPPPPSGRLSTMAAALVAFARDHRRKTASQESKGATSPSSANVSTSLSVATPASEKDMEF